MGSVECCSFNDEFSDLYYAQKQLVIPDEDVRTEVRRELIKNLLPAYTEFYNRHEFISLEPIYLGTSSGAELSFCPCKRYSEAEFTKNQTKYLRYPPSSVKEKAGMFFQGLYA